MRRTAVSNTASRPSDSRLDDSRPARRLDAENVRYPGFGPGSTVLKAGTQYQEGGLPLPCDIVFDRDIALQLSDGTTIHDRGVQSLRQSRRHGAFLRHIVVVVVVLGQ
jgi:hypothetical protein